MRRGVYGDKNKKEKMGIKKILLLSTIFLGVLATTGLAAWVISITGATITGEIISDPDAVVFISSDFTSLGTVDVTNSSVQYVRSATLTNVNGNISFSVSFNETRIDLPDGCTDYENDISVVYSYEGETIISGDNITIPADDSTLEAQIDIVRSACPQNLSIETVLVEI